MVKRKAADQDEPKPVIKPAAVKQKEENARANKKRKGNDNAGGAGAGAGAGAGPDSKWADMDRHEFLQYLMKRGIVAETQAVQYFKRMVPGATDADFRAFIGELCSSLRHLSFTVKRQKTPCNDMTYVALVNRVADAPTKMASRLKPEQLNFTRFLIEKIATSPGAWVYKSTAINFGEDAARCALRLNDKVDAKKLRLKPQDAEDVLLQLCIDGFLMELDATKYALGPRAYLELGQMIENLEGLDEELKQKMDAINA